MVRRVRTNVAGWRPGTAGWSALVAICVLAGCGCAASGGASTTSATSQVTRAGPVTATGRPSPHRSAVQSGPPSGKLLAGKIVGIDPGHNGLNHADPAFLGQIIWNGREKEGCDTTGTQTASGYSEALFNFAVATDLAAQLRQQGASVVLTRRNNNGVGPCVDRRSRIIDAAHANVAIDIHADGGPTWGRGFTVLEPIADGYNNKVIASSFRFGRYVHAAFLSYTPMRVANYYGHDGYIARDDLAGLNLTTVPKVLIECGNMPNAADAALLTSPSVQRQIARALDAAIVRFLTGHWPPRG